MRQESTWIPPPMSSFVYSTRFRLRASTFARRAALAARGRTVSPPGRRTSSVCGRRVQRREGVERPTGRRRDVVAVHALLPSRADALGLSRAVHADAVLEARGRVVGRRGDIEQACLLVDRVNAHDVVVARRHQPDLLAVARDVVRVAPAVALAEPEQALATGQPDVPGHVVEPGLVLVDEHRPDFARRRVAELDLVGVLQSVELLEDDFLGVPRPIDQGDVDVVRVAGGLHPDDRPARRRHDAHADGRVRLAGLGMLERDRPRIELVRVVDHRENRHAVGVELPEGDEAAVGAPAEAVADPELLLVDPVGRPVDDVIRAVRGQRADCAVGQILDVDVVLDDVGGHAAVGRELGEHERRGLEARTELAEPARGQIVRPEIAPGVLPPHPAGIGHDDQDLAVGRPGVVLDGDGRRGSRRHQLGRRHEDLALAALGPVEDEIAAGPAAVGRLQGRVRIAVRHPPRRAKPLGGEIPRGEDPVQREQPGVGRFVLRACLSGEQDEGRGPEKREAVSSGAHARILLRRREARSRRSSGWPCRKFIADCGATRSAGARRDRRPAGPEPARTCGSVRCTAWRATTSSCGSGRTRRRRCAPRSRRPDRVRRGRGLRRSHRVGEPRPQCSRKCDHRLPA